MHQRIRELTPTAPQPRTPLARWAPAVAPHTRQPESLRSRSRPHLPAQSSQPIGTSAAQPGRAIEPVPPDASPAPRGSSGPRTHQVHSLSPSSANSRRGAAAAVPGGGASAGTAARAASSVAPAASMARRCLNLAPAAREWSEHRGNTARPRAEEGRSRRLAPSGALCPPRGRPREGHAGPGSSRCLAAVASLGPPAVGRPGSHPSSVPAVTPDLHPLIFLRFLQLELLRTFSPHLWWRVPPLRIYRARVPSPTSWQKARSFLWNFARCCFSDWLLMTPYLRHRWWTQTRGS